MSQQPLPGSVTRPGRSLRIALAVSVGLNLAVAGLIGGAMLRAGGPAGHGAMMRDPGFGMFTEALRPEDRADLRRRFVSQVPGFVRDRRAMQADLRTLLAVLRADLFDPVALDAIMATQAARFQDRIATGQGLIRDFLVDLPPEARNAFADRLEASLTRRRSGRNQEPGE